MKRTKKRKKGSKEVNPKGWYFTVTTGPHKQEKANLKRKIKEKRGIFIGHLGALAASK